jgi:N-acetylmuramoyl-L-alanine amidase
MILKECIFYENGAYKAAQHIKPVGIVVHSTGCDNEMLRRYVQPTSADVDTATILADLGKNIYNNHHNQEYINGVYNDICMHAYIGRNDKGIVEVYHTLPYNYACWGCGSGSKGSYNYDPYPHLQFEICEDSLNNKAYFDKAFNAAIEYCVYLCKKLNINVENIVSHKEAAKAGYASSHGDPENWLSKYGKNMDWFRTQVKNKLKTTADASKTKTIYRVQVGAYASEANAKAFLDKVKKAGFTNAFIRKVEV